MVKRDQAETYVTLHSDLDGPIVYKKLLKMMVDYPKGTQ